MEIKPKRVWLVLNIVDKITGGKMEKLIEEFRVLFATLKELNGKVIIQYDTLVEKTAACDREKRGLTADRKGVKKIKDVLAYEEKVDAQALANRRASASLTTQQEEVDIECAAKQKKAETYLSEAKSTRDDIDAERGRLRVAVKEMEEAKKKYKKDVLDVLGANTK